MVKEPVHARDIRRMVNAFSSANVPSFEIRKQAILFSADETYGGNPNYHRAPTAGETTDRMQFGGEVAGRCE
ncbi:hypothetical protein F441_17608 [Phytophthora nicotianae CJ01A1]|uniref:Uncharacterized protein n=2 Tax=Phytophthora nicotianae TaxID=4792 RepID=W2G1Z6_PHYNI|nr:hypothetical protein L915_17261 [Phytophthora nicotianae]ETL29762.1 hypothetical protein L916_17154 [Phytophthora nicotianae]ETP05908.1 hypothetical protein F441_17608 [Phytophthora nicotianae CJ01A1]